LKIHYYALGQGELRPCQGEALKVLIQRNGQVLVNRIQPLAGLVVVDVVLHNVAHHPMKLIRTKPGKLFGVYLGLGLVRVFCRIGMGNSQNKVVVPIGTTLTEWMFHRGIQFDQDQRWPIYIKRVPGDFGFLGIEVFAFRIVQAIRVQALACQYR